MNIFQQTPYGTSSIGGTLEEKTLLLDHTSYTRRKIGDPYSMTEWCL